MRSWNASRPFCRRCSATRWHLNRYAAEAGKPDGQRLEEYADANFPALRQEIVSPAPIHAELEKTMLAWWLTKVREYLGTGDADVRTLLGKRSPEEIANSLVAGTKLNRGGAAHQVAGGRAGRDQCVSRPAHRFRAPTGRARARGSRRQRQQRERR